jgi:amino acid transporter
MSAGLERNYMQIAFAFILGFCLVCASGFLYGRDEAKNPNYTRDALLSMMVVGATSIGCCMGALFLIHKNSIGF